MQELETLKREFEDFQTLKENILQYESFLSEELSEEEIQSLASDLSDLEIKLASWESKTLLGGPYDDRAALLSVRSGAGGVDAQDWAEMLVRMYTRYAEASGRSVRLIEQTAGAEAGIKNATLEISGNSAYGYLKHEAGTHRLVRLSPFNSKNLRQTSFAVVEVLPVILKDTEVDIKPDELRIDTFKSGGAGGQHVNTTDSAVRITHLTTGIVTGSQSERSQMQNKEEAMKALRGKLAQRKLAEQEEEKRALRGEAPTAEWGNQIRSYVLHPYTLVKDHRTEVETSQAGAVLDGDLEAFIEAGLRIDPA